MRVPTPPIPVPRITPVRSARSTLQPPGRPADPSPGAWRRGRTGCSGPSAAAPCGPGRRSRRSPGPRPRSANRQPRRVERVDRADARDRPRSTSLPRPSHVDAPTSLPSARSAEHRPSRVRDDERRRAAGGPVIGQASRCGRSRRDRRRPGGRGRRWHWRPSACRRPSAGSRHGPRPHRCSTSAHDAVGSPSNT
jgi:hypothetical protein